jgi:hypothetical protein
MAGNPSETPAQPAQRAKQAKPNSRRSCSEVQNCLHVALDQNYIVGDEFQSAYDHCVKVRKIIDGLIRYLKHHRKGPHKMTTDPSETPIQPAQRAKPAQRA